MIGASLARRAGVIVATACWTAVAFAQDPAATTVQRIAREWLQLTDRGEGAASWDAAARQFKNAVPRESWVESLKSARDPLGAVERRTILSTSFTRSFPGAPEGDYAIVLFRTSFAKKEDAAETVTLEHEADGAWRVVGYLIR